MEGHKYFIEGIPKALWKEFRKACFHFDMSAKDHLIAAMQSLVIRYHKELRDTDPDETYNLNGEDNK